MLQKTCIITLLTRYIINIFYASKSLTREILTITISVPIFKIGSEQFYRRLIGEPLFHVKSQRLTHQSGNVWNENRIRGNFFRLTAM